MKKYFLPAMLIACLLAVTVVPNLKAYDDNEDEEEEFSPWAAWRKGFSYFEKGEREKEKGNSSAALAAYRKAYQCYQSVKKARPNWNQQIIGSRIRMCEREIRKLSKKIGASSTTRKSSESYVRSKASDAELQDTKAELMNYKKKLFAALIELNELRQRNKQQKNYAEQVEDLMREKRILSEEYKLLQEKYSNLQTSKSKPDKIGKELKAQLVELKVKYDILAQRLKLQQKKEKDLKTEMAALYGYKTKTKTSIQGLEKVIQNLEYKLKKADKAANAEAKSSVKYANKIKSLETYNKQIAENLKEKDKEIEKLNNWLQQLRKKSGNQNEIQQEILKANQLVNKKYKELKKTNEKNVREIQQLNSLLRENNVAEVQLKKALQEINIQHATLGKEYKLLHKNYKDLLALQKDSTAEIKTLKEENAKAVALVKSYSNKYKWTKAKLKKRAVSDIENISTLNKQIRELNKKIDQKTVSNKSLKFQLDSVNSKYENLKVTYAKLKKSHKGLRVNEKILAQEAESSKKLKQKIAELRADMKSLEEEHGKEISKQSKSYANKLAIAEKKLSDIQKKYKSFKDQSSKLSIAANKISQLNEQLKHANKTIEILRNVGGKKVAFASKTQTVKHTAAVTKYTPQVTTNQPVNLKKLLADGMKAEKDDSEELAIWNYRKYLSVKPNNIDVNRRLGTILFRRGQNKEALEMLQKAYSQTPDDISTAIVYAQALIQQKKFANASGILQKATKKQPRNYKLLTSYASALAGTGKTAAALDKLAEAIKILPDDPKAYLARAQIITIYHPDLLDTAASSYRKARKLGAKPDAFLEDALSKKLAKVDKNAEMIEFLKAPAKEAERNRDWASAAWYFGQLYKLKPSEKQYQEKFAAALLLQKKYKKSLKALDLKKLTNNGRLIAASAELCQGNCTQAAALIKNAKSTKDMPEYFKAVKANLKSIVPKTPDKKKEFTQVHSQIDKLL